MERLQYGARLREFHAGSLRRQTLGRAGFVIEPDQAGFFPKNRKQKSF
jgi:hypothetical protein